MRYINKTQAPAFFKDDTKDLNNWHDYGKVKGTKRRLKQHIIEQEQNALCVYCEGKVGLDDSHIEHLKPKGKYPQLTFDYQNLAVSCNGTLHNQDDDTQQKSCGHKKDNEYDEALFLDPSQLTDIRDYFVYDIEDSLICPADKSPEQAQYAIKILQLNSDGLPQARGNALRSFRNTLARIKDVKQRKAKVMAVIKAENKPFVSFLRYHYRALF